MYAMYFEWVAVHKSLHPEEKDKHKPESCESASVTGVVIIMAYLTHPF